MTRTQLQGLTNAELVTRARQAAEPYTTTGNLILELADRLDDQFAFVSTPQPDPDQQELS